MGKGKGKLASWFSDVPSGIFLVEYKNLRPGRVNYFSKQFQFKLTALVKLKHKNYTTIQLAVTNSIKIKYGSIW